MTVYPYRVSFGTMHSEESEIYRDVSAFDRQEAIEKAVIAVPHMSISSLTGTVVYTVGKESFTITVKVQRRFSYIGKYSRTMNQLESAALERLYCRSYKDRCTYIQYRRKAWYSGLDGCWFVEYCGMTVGIESDGYTHS
jgi:hypothetical protein